MKWQPFLVLGSIAQVVAGLKLIGESDDNGVVCHTYLSTYLVAVAVETAGPAPILPTTRGILPPYFTNRSTSALPQSTFPADRESSTILLDPESTVDLLTSSEFVIPTQSSDLFSSTAAISSEASTTSSQAEVTGQAVIFFVAPSPANKKRNLVKRVIPSGFVNGANSADVCTDAGVFQLADGQLLDDGSPIYYNGEPYKQFASDGTPPDGAITRQFANVNGNLVFTSSSLPNTNAGFCQDDSGRVYITFGSGPPGCDPVLLKVYTVEQCRNGEITGPSQSSSISSDLTQSPVTASTDVDSSFVSSGSQEPTSTVLVEPTDATLSSDTSPAVTQTQSTDTTDEAATVTADSSYTNTFSQSSFLTPSLSLTSSSISTITSQSISLLPTSSSSADSTVTAVSTDLSSLSESSLEPSSSTILSTDSTVTTVIESSTEETTASFSTTTLPEESETTTTAEEATTTAEDTTATETTTDPGETTTTAEETTTTAEETTTTLATTTTGCDSVSALTTAALSNPTPVFDDSTDHDNDVAEINLPFDVAGSGQGNVYVSENGLIGVDSSTGADRSVNQPFPSLDIPRTSICPYWDDLYLDRSRGDTIVYEVFEGEHGTQATFEWVVSKASVTGTFHFTATIYANYPEIFRFQYYISPEQGLSATVGAQNLDQGVANIASYNSAGGAEDGSVIYFSLNGITEIQPFDNTECGKADTSDDSSLFYTGN